MQQIIELVKTRRMDISQAYFGMKMYCILEKNYIDVKTRLYDRKNYLFLLNCTNNLTKYTGVTLRRRQPFFFRCAIRLLMMKYTVYLNLSILFGPLLAKNSPL